MCISSGDIYQAPPFPSLWAASWSYEDGPRCLPTEDPWCSGRDVHAVLRQGTTALGLNRASGRQRKDQLCVARGFRAGARGFPEEVSKP